jgi:hypothetical protein
MDEAERPLDLSSNVDLTVLLLHDTFWRARVVETITVDRANAMRAHRSLQTGPIEEALTDVIRMAAEKREKVGYEDYSEVDLPDPDQPLPDRVQIVIPMGSLPKRTMVGFDVRSEQGPVYLLKRRETALRQAAYLCSLAEEATNRPVSARVHDLLVAMCEFPPGPWQFYREGRGRTLSIDARLKKYLSKGLKLSVSDEDLAAWKEFSEPIGQRMLVALREKPNEDSSSENILLALPLLVEKIEKRDDVLDYLRELHDLVIERCSPNGEIPRFLQIMAEYGRRYDALVSCVINVHTPTLVEMAQDFPLKVGVLGHCEVEVPFADAASNHVAVRVTDPDVEIRARAPRTPQDTPVEGPQFNLVRRSKEDFALYGSEKNRPARLRVRFRLALPWTSRLAMASFMILTLAAFVVLAILPVESNQDLGVFVVPTTLAAGFVLGQHRTSLAMRLQQLLRTLTVAVILVLWTYVVIAYLSGWVVGNRP